MLLRLLARAFLRSCLYFGSAALLAFGSIGVAQHTAQRGHTSRTVGREDETTLNALLLSDLHFEPFQDPAKFAQLREAPVEQWPAIFNAPPSQTRDADFAALQQACPVRGIDTSWTLLTKSLQQAATTTHPLFITVSGDLLAHAFDCRYDALAPHARSGELSAFAAKTVAFLTLQVRAAFPSTPVYWTLGNNDTGCTDYREDIDSSFLQHAASAFAASVPDKENSQAILRDFATEGGYNVALPAPMQNARLIALQDLFESDHYATCAGRPDPSVERSQMTWLKAQLDRARVQHQHVWVMAHLPLGIDVYSTVRGHRNVCQAQQPVSFLDSPRLAQTLEAYPDVVTLAIFAHTHADELRFLHAPGSARGIAVKLIGSISPLNGNQSSFTVAQVDESSAQMLDYTVYLAGNGAAAIKEYSFRPTYHEPAFNAVALASITAEFLSDAEGTRPRSQAYQHLYFPGDTGFHAAAMQLLWRSYACSLREDTVDAYRHCVCASAQTQ